MFPWVYGFQWTPTHIIFTGVFLTVLTAIAITVMMAFFRTFRVYLRGKQGQVAWQSLFHDLPAADRACRHAITGESKERICEQGFDCRQCSVHSKLASPATPEPLERLYHRGHTWVESGKDGTLTIGLDDIASRLIGPVEHIQVPAAGSAIEANTPAFSIRKKGALLRVLAPVDGVVLEANPKPGGWLVRVKPPQVSSLAHLLRSSEATAWFELELERLQLAASPVRGIPALADGGVLIDDVSSVLPGDLWEKVCGEILLDV